MLDIRFGLIASEFECCPEDIQSHIQYLEYRVDISEDAMQCAGPGSPCTAHAPDVQCDNAIGVFEALADQPRVMLVNVHARPSDEYTLCQSCGRRLVNSKQSAQRCDHCGTPLADWQIDPAVQADGFSQVIPQLKLAQDILARANKRLSVENTYEPPHLMRRILDALPQSVGFTLDVGHAMIYHGNPIEYIDILADRLCHLHLHDNLGGNSEMYHDLHLPPGCGRGEWAAIRRALERNGFRGTATFECLPRSDWIKNWIGPEL